MWKVEYVLYAASGQEKQKQQYYSR